MQRGDDVRPGIVHADLSAHFPLGVRLVFVCFEPVQRAATSLFANRRSVHGVVNVGLERLRGVERGALVPNGQHHILGEARREACIPQSLGRFLNERGVVGAE